MQERRNRLCSTPSLFFGGGFGGICLGGENSHSPSSTAEGSNECSYIATHRKRLHGVYKITLPSTFTSNSIQQSLESLYLLDKFSAFIVLPL